MTSQLHCIMLTQVHHHRLEWCILQLFHGCAVKSKTKQQFTEVLRPNLVGNSTLS